MVSITYGWRGGNGSFSDPNHWRSSGISSPFGPPSGPPTPDDNVTIVYRSEAGFPGSSAEVTQVSAGALVVKNFLQIQGGPSYLELDAASLSIFARTTGGGSGGVGVTGLSKLNVSGTVTLDTVDTSNVLLAGFMSVGGVGTTSPAKLTAGSLVVGKSGFGTLSVGYGVGSPVAADVTVNGPLTIGSRAGSKGNVSLYDQHDKLTVHGNTVIGGFGTGTLLVRDGAGTNVFSASGHAVTLGQKAGSVGNLNLFGGMLAKDLYVGGAGTGNLLVSEEDALAPLTGNFVVGLSAGGKGTARIENGGALEATNVGLGFAAGASGVLTVTGTSTAHHRALLHFKELFGVGGAPGGTGILTVSKAGEVKGDSKSDLLVALDKGSHGTVTVTDKGSILNTGNLQVGSHKGGGTGLFSINEGAKVTVADQLFVEKGGKLVLSGTGSLVAPKGLVEDGGTFDISASKAGASLSTLSGTGTVALGSKTLTLTKAAGSYSGTITGAGGILKIAGGTEKLDHANSHKGGTLLAGGTLDLAAKNAAGLGAITFGSGAQTLKVENAALSGHVFLTVIKSFGTGDVIDLTGLAFKAGATATYSASNHHLTVKSGSVTDTLTLLTPQQQTFKAASDGHGGTKIIFGSAVQKVAEAATSNDALSGDATGTSANSIASVEKTDAGAGFALSVRHDHESFDFTSVAKAGQHSSALEVVDFRAGHDSLDLSRIDADTHAAGNQRFDFIGMAAFHHEAGELRFAGHVLAGDVNGDGVADFEISLAHVGSLSKADLVL